MGFWKEGEELGMDKVDRMRVRGTRMENEERDPTHK